VTLLATSTAGNTFCHNLRHIIAFPSTEHFSADGVVSTTILLTLERLRAGDGLFPA